MLKIEMLTDDELLAATRGLVKRTNAVTAELLTYLGEVDERRLYLGRAFPSMFQFCTGELGFSQDVACNRIAVARLARRLPVALDAFRAGRMHLTGLRILGPHLTEANIEAMLSEAAGKSKEEIEMIAARLAPKPPVPSSIRKVPVRSSAMPPLIDATPAPRAIEAPPSAPVPVPTALSPAPVLPRALVKPLAEDLFKFQFSGRRELREKVKEAQDLLRHSVPDGDLAEIFERALDLLIPEVKKQRFAVGRKARTTSTTELERTSATRDIPDPIKRSVYERDGGHCTFVAPDGRRCKERGNLEFDHANGFARDPTHTVEGIRLRCRAHNQHAADLMYGRDFMENARRSAKVPNQETATRPGADTDLSRPAQALLL